jgi:hypothetical protein
MSEKMMTHSELFTQIRAALLFEQTDVFDDPTFGPKLQDTLKRLAKNLVGYTITEDQT